MRASLLGLVAVLLLLGAQAAAARPHRTCPPRAGERVEAKSAQAVVLYATRSGRLIGCSRASGHRRTIDRLGEKGLLNPTLASVRLAGTRAAWVIRESDRKSSLDSVFANDALHPRMAREIRQPQWPGWRGDHVTSLAVSARGAVAWTVTQELETRLYLSERAGDVRRADRGFAVSGATISGTTLRWRHGTTAMHETLPLPPSACGPRMTTGTFELDLSIWPGAMTICRRSDGRNATIPTADPAEVNLDGVRALTTTAEPGDRAHGHLILLDLDSNTQRTIGAPALPYTPIVTPAGIAWTTEAESASDHGDVWVEDGDGQRRVETFPAWSTQRLGADGNTVRWTSWSQKRPGPLTQMTLAASPSGPTT